MADMSLDMNVVNAELNKAIDLVMRTHASEAFLSRFVLVAETVDNEGERGLWISASEGMRPWDVLGFTAYGHEQAKCEAMGFSDEEEE